MTSFSGPGEWYARWPHFRPDELTCKCHRYCEGDLVVDEDLLDRMEVLRRTIARPLKINSGHRCRLHNGHIGGANYSQHKRLAVDISLTGHDPATLFSHAQSLGFLGIGVAETFIHLDMRREIDGYQPPRRLTIWKYQAKWPKWFSDYVAASRKGTNMQKKDLIT